MTLFAKKTLVSAVGCFNEIKPEHLLFLGYCLGQGDRLTIGVLGDALAAQKHENTVPHKVRQRALLNLNIAAKVTVIEDNIVEFLKREQPAIHCISSMDRGDTPVEAYCKSNGIEIVYVTRMKE